ncbi:type II secretion system protein [Campylobacter canadensis]|uniref:Type II secretion system protein n=1 Tax=Campylobacter canadensis TaxID=449520 RepID=A0ABS7WR07_9BACT|nr:type II secretion system protein [Campylobacter canadensis]MBZ7987198.1 type II secretion system protein [Campylobacter canadensis]MBZ7994450.1 type II secretion system protein [Campylobacter canadensis]MBZ7996463.1 type II secretion system protein [Campylobacter canadensis]MBZ7998178.1 type II secretion system protein [Campylobacter canadensis]MBZ7999835.1 type II secretion system protein [Campylobacter canadensis]
MKKAFTMIEIVFVLVILGILAGIAMPKLFLTRSDALVLKARDEVAKVNAALLAHGQEQMYKTGFITFPIFNCTNRTNTKDVCIITEPFSGKESTYFSNLFESGADTNGYKKTNNIGWGKISAPFTKPEKDQAAIFDTNFKSGVAGSQTAFIVYITENKKKPKTYYFVYNYKEGRLECVNPSDWTSKDLNDYPALECW